MTKTAHVSIPRRKALLALAALGAVPALQGCFPVVATGAGVGAAMFADRRTSGSYVEDEGIEWRTRNRIKERFGDAVNVSITSYNRNVLLTGEVPDEPTRAEIETIAKGVTNVRAVINETQVAGISPLSARATDAVTTSQVKARFVDTQTFGAHHVKVVTEAGTVFLMGLVTRAEADAATEVARTTNGVRKVVRVFEYISDDEARRLDARVGQSK
ncbi:BON domain-containing protein [Pseudothauera rhizosphaerae]|uniref:BON domain-containing protein n=1 Tax=Pseudothauera rhizosphaerae TaxID=2565932 RepID=A0A4S4ANN8_9RHOO|nr:BON domain-containing protein [Pseudothauera rhizosphaerae]THF61202.1 BON domain-containing protein [Pseudothauera rhizosphaerae]